jgi:hypothetical protein
MLVGLALLATVGMSACSANRTPSSNGPANGEATSSAAAAVPVATTSAPTSSATPAAARAIQNLVVTSTIRGELTAAFLAQRSVPLAEVAGGGPMPGSVYYAYDPATSTYWAAANFTPINTLSLSALEAFQNGGDIGMFRKVGAGPWQVQTGASSLTCLGPKYFPQSVFVAWSLAASCRD